MDFAYAVIKSIPTIQCDAFPRFRKDTNSTIVTFMRTGFLDNCAIFVSDSVSHVQQYSGETPPAKDSYNE